MPRPPRGEGEDMTRVGHEGPEEVSDRETSASRGRVLDMLRALKLRQEAHTRAQADEEMVRTGHEEKDLADLQKAYDKVMQGKAHEAEQLLRDNLPPTLSGDIDRIVEVNRQGGL